MKESKKEAYVAGVIGLAVSAVLLLMGFNGGLEALGGQLFVVFGVFFGILGIGSIIKPDVVGPVLSQIIENIARNNSADQARVTTQKQTNTKNSSQINVNGPANITQTYYKKP